MPTLAQRKPEATTPANGPNSVPCTPVGMRSNAFLNKLWRDAQPAPGAEGSTCTLRTSAGHVGAHAAMAEGQYDEGGFLKMIGGDAFAGHDPETGPVGFLGKVLGFAGSTGDTHPIDLEMKVGEIGAEATVGPEALSIGAGWTGISGAVSLGGLQADRANDTRVKFGAGFGGNVDGGLAGHDLDHDGHREWEVNGELMGFPVGLKSEDPLGLLMRGPVARPGVPNLTDATANHLVETVSALSGVDEEILRAYGAAGVRAALDYFQPAAGRQEAGDAPSAH